MWFPEWLEWFGDCFIYFFSCNQAALWMVQSVRPSVGLSVCPSVCPSVTPFSLSCHHRISVKISGVITNDRTEVHVKGQGQRSKVKATEVKRQLSRFRTVTPVQIYTYRDEIINKAWWCLGEVRFCLSRSSVKFQSHAAKKNRFWPKLGVSGL